MIRKLLSQQALRRRLQQEPYYRFVSFEELQLAASWGLRIEANRASVDDWLRLPGLSIHQARQLAELASRGIAFYCIEDVAAALGIPLQQVAPWEPILQFCYYEDASDEILEGSQGTPPSYALEPRPLSVNTATAQELATIPGVDAFLGRAIVHYRHAGPYRDLADLQDRLRLTTAAAARLMHYLKF